MHPVETVSGNILNSFHMDLAEKLGATWNQLQCKSGYLWYFRQQLALALHPNPVSNLLCKVETDCLFPGRVMLPGPTDHSISLGDFVCKDWVWGREGKRRGGGFTVCKCTYVLHLFNTWGSQFTACTASHSALLTGVVVSFCEDCTMVYPGANVHCVPLPLAAYFALFFVEFSPLGDTQKSTKVARYGGKKSYEITICRQ
jgi:hypothetical protein